ncbi:MAG: aldehyde dehydrogenase family protein, partial [Pseudolabrys sp.]
MLDVARKPGKSASAPAVKDVLNFIAGEYVPAKSGKTFDKHSPVDGALIARVSEAGQAEVNAAVEAARAALDGPWGKLTTAERGELLYALANGINARFDDFLAAEVADTGKPMSLASHIDIPRGAANFKVFADTIKNVSTEFFEMATPDGAGGKNPAIVFADCDLDAALEGTMRSCLANCGQVCLGTERVYVERPLFDTFVAALKERTEKLKLGRP